MTFEEWLTTKVKIDEPTQEYVEAFGEPESLNGFNGAYAYDGQSFIDISLEGKYYLIIGNMQWVDYDLAVLERLLWVHHADANMNDPISIAQTDM